MPWCSPQVVGIPYDCSATGLLSLEVHVYEQQLELDRMEPFRASQNDWSSLRWNNLKTKQGVEKRKDVPGDYE